MWEGSATGHGRAGACVWACPVHEQYRMQARSGFLCLFFRICFYEGRVIAPLAASSRPRPMSSQPGVSSWPGAMSTWRPRYHGPGPCCHGRARHHGPGPCYHSGACHYGPGPCQHGGRVITVPSRVVIAGHVITARGRVITPAHDNATAGHVNVPAVITRPKPVLYRPSHALTGLRDRSYWCALKTLKTARH